MTNKNIKPQTSSFKRSSVVMSVIIANYNGGQYLGQCLDSLMRRAKGKGLRKRTQNLELSTQNFEIIVVDDGSSDDSVKIITKIQRRKDAKMQSKSQNTKSTKLQKVFSNIKHQPSNVSIKIIKNRINLGAARARNIGAKAARGKYLFFLDADTEVLPDCLEQVFSYLNRRPEVSAVQTKLLKGNTDRIDSAGHHLTFFGFPYEIGVGEPEVLHRKTKIVFGARTTALAVRKSVFDTIGGFDEDYLIYGEDTDLCWRIWLAGGEIHYFPEAGVRHFEKSSLTTRTRSRLYCEGAKNQVSNILKNSAGREGWFLLPGNLAAWLLLSGWLLVRGKPQFALAVWEGIFWNLRNLAPTISKRRQISRAAHARPLDHKLIFGSTGLRRLFIKGVKWLKNA